MPTSVTAADKGAGVRVLLMSDVHLDRGFAWASEQVQQEFAPLLQQAIVAELPRITLGRYEHVRVDPDPLEVQVSPDESEWRQAKYLSRGTAEQIYLLLRLAMAEHAVATDEPAPLILDDVTVQRTRCARSGSWTCCTASARNGRSSSSRRSRTRTCGRNRTSVTTIASWSWNRGEVPA